MKMNPGKLNNVCNCIENAFQKVVYEVAELKFTRDDNLPKSDGKKYLVVVGLVGLNNGRILFEMNEGLAQKIIEGMNGEPLENDADIYPCLAEFTNMVSGNGIISINNNYIGNDLRLTPPVIFMGNDLEVTSLKVDSVLRSYHTENGAVQIEVGFEVQ
jgi:chemotaxis protein CheX